MREIAESLLHTAADLTSDVMVVIQDKDLRKRDNLSAKIENFLFQIRKNEGLNTFVHRRDESEKTTMVIAVSNHEAKEAIVKALWRRAEREAGNANMRVWTKELKSNGAMRSAAELVRVARLIGVHE
jgi:hypothetical protein